MTTHPPDHPLDQTRHESPGPATEVSRRRRVRLTAVVAAVLATLALWATAAVVFEVDLLTPATPDHPSQRVGPVMVATVALTAAAAGWGLLAVLERFVARARTIWTVVAVAVLLASFAGPLSGSGITVANRAILALLHVTVAAVVIPALRRSSPAR
jgi:hypothetical protein